MKALHDLWNIDMSRLHWTVEHPWLSLALTLAGVGLYVGAMSGYLGIRLLLERRER